MINCIVADDEPLARQVIKSFIEQIPYLSLINEFDNAWALKEFLENQSVDLLFLDIEMPGLDGLTFGKNIKNKVDGKIIYITAHREYAVDAFDANALDYLLKPVAFDRFLQAVDKYRSSASEKSEHNPDEIDFVFVPVERRNIKLFFDEILYVEAKGDYLRIYRQEGKPVIVKYTLNKFREQLSNNFLQIHRSFIVNKRHITAYQKSQIEISGTWLTISRSYQEEIDQILNKFRID